jgi:hypothetical protein
MSGSSVVELRQYTLHSGARDPLIELFDREFVESQEALGMEVIGQFRDLDDPNRFVWIRGFADMTSRAPALAAFYGGPVWREHREAANATMIDSDDVLLLRPAGPSSGFALEGFHRPPPGTDEDPRGFVAATICHLEGSTGARAATAFEREVAPVFAETGARVAATFLTEPSANDFPALPVREGENVLVWFSCFADEAAYVRHVELRSRPEHRARDAANALAPWLSREPEVLRLAPTRRSRLR